MIDFRQLIKAGVHFGHQKTRWCPKMEPYIWGFKNNIHLIDVSKTALQLEKASKFLESIAAQGKTILWAGTKKAAQDPIYNTAVSLSMPYVNHRWIGGTLSNNSQVKKSVTKLLHLEDIIARAEKEQRYTKKELSTFQKMTERLMKNVGGIRQLAWPIGAIVIVDVIKEQSALKEAARMGIPVVALVDTNGDPSLIDYVIPANDDAPRSIQIILDYLAQGVQKGQALAVAAAEEKKVARQQAAASKAKSESKPAEATTENKSEEDKSAGDHKVISAVGKEAKSKSAAKVVKKAPKKAEMMDKE